ncbi:MAG: PhzF family phenazine biosynthesis protein [Blastocatellales bacterium]
MPNYSFVQCDVFTNQAFRGNPLAVFPDGQGIDDETMQRIAREMNLSETVFVLPPTDPGKALRRLRIFTPGMELPLAGHPVVGTWNVLARLGVVKAPASGDGLVTVHQELKVGILPVGIEFANGEPAKVVMTQPVPTIGQPLPIGELAARALGLGVEEVGHDLLPAVVASAGNPFLMLPLRNRAALSRIKLNNAALAELLEPSGSHGVFAFSESGSPDALISARMFAEPELGISEDPATGSAAGPCAAVLTHFGFAPAVNGTARFTIEQGVDMGRASYIEAEVEVNDGGIQVVRIAGSSVVVAKGEMFW